MNLERYSSDKLKTEVRAIVGKYLDLNIFKVFFFGSRVKGDNLPHSDIDIGVIGPMAMPSEKKLQIEDELSSIRTLYKIDFVDFACVSEGFRHEALKKVEYV